MYEFLITISTPLVLIAGYVPTITLLLFISSAKYHEKKPYFPWISVLVSFQVSQIYWIVWSRALGCQDFTGSLYQFWSFWPRFFLNRWPYPLIIKFISIFQSCVGVSTWSSDLFHIFSSALRFWLKTLRTGENPTVKMNLQT